MVSSKCRLFFFSKRGVGWGEGVGGGGGGGGGGEGVGYLSG